MSVLKCMMGFSKADGEVNHKYWKYLHKLHKGHEIFTEHKNCGFILFIEQNISQSLLMINIDDFRYFQRSSLNTEN